MIWAWLLWIAAGLALELAGWYDERHLWDDSRWHTLTYWVKKYVPKTMIAAALAWLAVHFGVDL